MKFIDPHSQIDSYSQIFSALNWKAIIKRCFSPSKDETIEYINVRAHRRVGRSVGREVFALESTKYDNAASALTKITNFSGRHCCYSHYRFTLYSLFFFRKLHLSLILSWISFSPLDFFYSVDILILYITLFHGLCGPAAAGSGSFKLSFSQF